MKTEKRLSLRKPLKEHKPVTYQLNLPDEDNATIAARIFNISAGGVGIMADRKALPGNLLRLGLPCESSADIEIPVLAEVRWAEPNGSTGEYILGLQFLF